MKTSIIIFTLQLCSQFCMGCIKDSIFYNANNPKTDRILLFEHKYFVWLSEEPLNQDTILKVVFGKYHLKNDSIFFTPPDSLDKANNFFCFCKTKYDAKKRFQFYSKKNKYSSDNLEYVYRRIFKRNKSNYTEIGISKTFQTVRKGEVLELLPDKEKYILLKE